jgi:hypothetical protein
LGALRERGSGWSGAHAEGAGAWGEAGRERMLKVRERGGKRVGSGTLRDRAGSGNLGSGERFGRSGARPGVRFRDAPTRSADRGSGPGGGGGGDASATWVQLP